jgi:hypothetical protein
MNDSELLAILKSLDPSTQRVPPGLKRFAQAICAKYEAELQLYRNALWKACGDDEEMVNATLESQR